MTSLNSTHVNQHRSDFIGTDLARRLQEAFEFAGITNLADQVEKIVEVCEVKNRTAKLYVSSQFEMKTYRRSYILYPLAKALGVDSDWLLYGSGWDPQQYKYMKFLQTLSEKQINQNLRFFIRLINKDAKAMRLLDMCSKDQITFFQLLSMM